MVPGITVEQANVAVGALTAAITALAIFFALRGPQRLAQRQAEDREREERESFRSSEAEVLYAVNESLRTYMVAGALLENPNARGPILNSHSRTAWRAARVLEVLLDKRVLSDGLIRLSVDAIVLAQEAMGAVDTVASGRNTAEDGLTLLEHSVGRAYEILKLCNERRVAAELPPPEPGHPPVELEPFASWAHAYEARIDWARHVAITKGDATSR